MAVKKIIDLEVQSNADQAIGSLRTQLRQAQQEVAALSDKFGATSKEAVEAAKRAADLKDRIGDAKALTDAFNPDAKFKALSASLSGVAGGFGAVQGAIGLIGNESQDVEKALLKVQSAMALSQGLQALGESADAFKQLKAVAVNAMNSIKAAIGSTGIGLLVVALGAIYTYWDDIKETVSGVSDEQRKLNELAHTNYETAKEQLKTISNQDNVLKLQGKSEREILEIKSNQIKATIKKGEIELKRVAETSKAEEAAALRNYELTKNILDMAANFAYFLPKIMLIPIDLAIKGANKVSEALGLGKAVSFDVLKTVNEMQDKTTSFLAKQLFDPAEVKAKGEETRKEIQGQINELNNQRAGYQLGIKDIDNKAQEERDKKSQEEKEKRDKKAQEDLEALKAFQKAVREAEEEDLLQKIKDKEAEDERWQETTKEIREREQKEYEWQLALEEDKRKKIVEFEENKNKAIAMSKQNLQNIIDGLESTGLAKTKAGQAIAKGIALAQIGIDSAVAISKASTLANAEGVAMQLAFPTLPGAGTIGRVLSYASTTAQVASNIMRAKKLLSGSGDSGAAASSGGVRSGGGGGSTPQMTPQFNVVGNTGVNALANSINQQPIQAYVVAQNVTTAQSMNRNIVQSATLG